MLDKSELSAISDLLDSKLQPIHERLDQIDDRLDRMDGRLDQMDGRLDQMDSRLDLVESRLDRIEADIADIKEDAAITRTATNKLIEWAEATHDRVGKPVPDFPIYRMADG